MLVLGVAVVLVGAYVGFWALGGNPQNGNVAPQGEGANLYAANCQRCHGAIQGMMGKGITAQKIRSAMGRVSQMSAVASLTDAQVQAIANTLK